MIWKSDLVRQFPARWTLYWLLIPNLVIILMWPIGGPPMRAALAIFGPLALIVSQLPWRAARTVGIALLTIWMAAMYVCSLFAIPTLNYSLLAQFLRDVRPFHSPEYLLAGAILLAVLVLAMIRAPAVPRFSKPLHYLLALFALFAFVNLDTAVTARTSTSYRTLPGAKAPFDSAVSQVALAPAAAQPHHVVLIVVESLGLPAGAEEKRLFAAAWDRPEWRSRYEVSHGASLYYGATTSGELRELCGRWTHHDSFDFDHADCLPAKFRKAGYRTTGMHSFGGWLFGRDAWYRKLGFQSTAFADSLLREGAGQCDGVFPGACDKDVPAMIAQRLAAAKSPQFVYWLTLNTHLPVPADEHTAGGRCTVGAPEWRDDFPVVCRLFQMHGQLADAVGRMAMSPGLPPTDILIVGDHKPPFFDRASRARFDQAHVPWIYLKARRTAAPAVTAPGVPAG